MPNIHKCIKQKNPFRDFFAFVSIRKQPKYGRSRSNQE